jgi:hypothetical protein
VTDRPPALGDQVHERAVLDGRPHEATWTVVEYVRPTRVVLESDNGRGQLTYMFTPDSEATRLQREFAYLPPDFTDWSADPTTVLAHDDAR